MEGVGGDCHRASHIAACPPLGLLSILPRRQRSTSQLSRHRPKPEPGRPRPFQRLTPSQSQRHGDDPRPPLYKREEKKTIEKKKTKRKRADEKSAAAFLFRVPATRRTKCVSLSMQCGESYTGPNGQPEKRESASRLLEMPNGSRNCAPPILL